MKNKEIRYVLLAGASCALLLSVGSMVDADIIQYPDKMGNTVWFRDIAEASGTDATPLYGPPVAVGNSLDFNPVGFNSFSAGAAGNDITDGTLTMKIEAKPGNGVTDLIYSEAGDFTLLGFGTDGTLASVRSSFFVNVLAVDGVGINPINLEFVMDVTPQDGLYQLATLGGGPLQQGNWTGSLLIDLGQALADAGQPYSLGATLIAVTLDNTLATLSEDGTSAFIAKKDFGGTSITVVPEPAGATLALLGALGLFLRCSVRS
jgi:hypothetical protein